MQTLEPILEVCTEFPYIHLDQHAKINLKLNALVKQIQTIVRIPKSARTQAESELISSKHFIEKMLIRQPQYYPYSFLEILDESWIQEKIESQRQAMLIWSYFIEQYFFLEDKAATLNLIYTAEDFFYHPIRFSALIFSLCRFDIEPNELIRQGLFHRYFACQVIHLEDVKQCYELLNLASSSLNISTLLSHLQTTHCGLDHFPQHNLLGQYKVGHLNPIRRETPNPKTWVIPEAQLKNLIHTLGPCCFRILIRLDPRYHPIQSSLNAWLQTLKTEDLIDLVVSTLHSFTFDDSFKLLKLITEGLSPSIIQTLIEGQPHLFWCLFASAKLAEQIPKKKLQATCLQQEIQAKDINYVFSLTLKLKHLFEIKDDLYLKMAQIYLNDPELELEKKVHQTLKKNLIVKKYIQDRAQKCFKNLLTTIQTNLQPFNRDSYLNIRDVFFAQANLVAKLKQFEVKLTAYPNGHYGLSSLILTKVFQMQPASHPIDLINVIVPDHVDASSLQSHRKRLLEAWLEVASSTEEKLAIMQVLHQEFAYSKTMLQYRIDLDSHQLFKMGMKNASCFTIFLKLHTVPELENFLLQGQSKKIIKQILSQPNLISALLFILPEQILISFIELSFNHHNLIDQVLKNMNIFNFEQTQISKASLIKLLSLKNYAGQGLIELAISQPASLDIIISHMIRHELPFMQIIEAFPSVLQNKTTVTRILKYASQTEILALLQRHPACFRLIAQNLSLLRQLLLKFGTSHFIPVIKDFKDEERSEILLLLLEKRDCFNLLFHMIPRKNLLHILLLQATPFHRLPYFELKQLFMHYCIKLPFYSNIMHAYPNSIHFLGFNPPICPRIKYTQAQIKLQFLFFKAHEIEKKSSHHQVITVDSHQESKKTCG